MRSAAAIRALASVSFLLGGCRAATELKVEVTTDVSCERYAGTTIVVGSLGKFDPARPSSESTVCEKGSIGTVVLTPTGAEDGEVAFELLTGIGVDPAACTEGKPSCIVARRALKYLANEPLEMTVPMREFCAGVVCDPASTCSKNGCVPAKIDPNDCAGAKGCDESALAGGSGGGGSGGGGAGGGGGNSGGDVVELALGRAHGCAALRDGSVKCWGVAGDLGFPNRTTDATTPIDIGLHDIAQVASTGYANTTAAVDANGEVYVWGDNLADQIPGRPFGPNAPPTKVKTPARIARVVVGTGPLCALAVGNARLFCWGEIVGTSTATDVTEIDLGGGIVDEVAAGNLMVVLRMHDGSLRSFGALEFRGQGKDTPPTMKPTAISGVSGVTALAFTFQDVIATRANDKGYIWGVNHVLELGIDNGFAPIHTPASMPSRLEGLRGIALGVYHACGIKDGAVLCWGDNSNLAIGDPDGGSYVLDPLEVKGLPDPKVDPATKVWSGANFSCARTASGEIRCWGANDHGQLGSGPVLGAMAGAPPRKLDL